jgi:hypothetical protein
MPVRKLKTAKESRFAAEVRRMLGVGPDTDVVMKTPEFHRPRGATAPAAPPTDFEALRGLDSNALRELGCSVWSEPDDKGTVLVLLPGEWYSSIPDGTELESISHCAVQFRRGMTSAGIRFGCLAYGLRVKESRGRG